MARKFYRTQTSFGRGEVQPELALRRDLAAYLDGAKRLRNVRLLGQGGWRARPGLRALRTLPAEAPALKADFEFSSSQRYTLLFYTGRMDAYTHPDGEPAGSITGAPWTAAQLAEATWTSQGDVVFLAHTDFQTQILRRTGAASWARENIDWSSRVTGQTNQPFWKFAADEVTLTPSARTGDIVLSTSEPHWSADHVGCRVRYLRAEIIITSVQSTTTARGKVVHSLNRSQRVQVKETREGSYEEDFASFMIGQAVKGDRTDANGEIFSKGDHYLDIVITSGSGTFEGDGENILGPTGELNSEEVEDIAPGPTRDWDEQMFSTLRGYCSAIGYHRDRLWLGAHKSIPNAVLASRTGFPFDMRLSSSVSGESQIEDDAPIFELIGDSPVAKVKHFVSAEQLLVLTDQGPYYVPESEQAPISPTSIAFWKVDKEPVRIVRPGLLDGGCIYIKTSGYPVGVLRPTGNQRRSWESSDLTLMSAHLFNGPLDTAYVSGLQDAPERYAFLVNADGTLAVLHTLAAEDVLGWTLWDTDGEFLRLSAMGTDVLAVVRRTIGGTTRYMLERFELGLDLDSTVQFFGQLLSDEQSILNAGTRRTQNGNRRITEAGGVRLIEQLWPDVTLTPTQLYGGKAAHLAGGTVHIKQSTEYFGTAVVGPTGNFSFESQRDGLFQAGLFFDAVCETLPPELDVAQQSISGRMKRIIVARVHVLESCRFEVKGQMLIAHPPAADVSLPPPTRTGPIEFRFLGWEPEPTITIVRAEPLTLTVLGISMEVAV